jgi:hypothetical protein
MKFLSIDRRLKAIEPAPVNPSELEKIEHDKILMQLFEGHFLSRLQDMACSSLVGEVKAALRMVGSRPFGHTRPDDYPYWCALDPVKGNHDGLAYRIRAAESLAWADVLVDLGDPGDSEDVEHYRKLAASDLEREKKERQTFCDKCGGDLRSWSCYSGNMQKLCRTCSMGL